MNANQIPTKLEIHYYLKDDTHSMDAFVYNECEYEILILIKELQSLLSLKDYTIEVEAITEGGVKSRLIVFIKNKQLMGLVLGIIGTVMASKLLEDKEMKILEKEKIKLEIQKLKKDLNPSSANDTLHIEISDIINSDIKIAKRKSNLLCQFAER